jgi:hypothetical protein
MAYKVLDVDPKDPREAKFFVVNAEALLNSGATISSATWSCSGLTFSSTTTTSYTAIAKIAGGQDGQDYAVDCAITTSDGETLYPPLRLRVRRASNPRAA